MRPDSIVRNMASRLTSNIVGTHGVYEVLSTSEKLTVLDIMANTDCTFEVALSVIALWLALNIEPRKQCFDNGEAPRSVKVGHYDNDGEMVFVATLS